MDEEDGRLGPRPRQLGRVDVPMDASTTSLRYQPDITRRRVPHPFAQLANGWETTTASGASSLFLSETWEIRTLQRPTEDHHTRGKS